MDTAVWQLFEKCELWNFKLYNNERKFVGKRWIYFSKHSRWRKFNIVGNSVYFLMDAKWWVYNIFELSACWYLSNIKCILWRVYFQNQVSFENYVVSFYNLLQVLYTEAKLIVILKSHSYLFLVVRLFYFLSVENITYWIFESIGTRSSIFYVLYVYHELMKT